MKTIRELVEIAENKADKDLQTAQWLVATSHLDILEQKDAEHTIIQHLSDQLANMPCPLTLISENLSSFFYWQIERRNSSNCNQWDNLFQNWLKQHPDAGRKDTQVPDAAVDKFDLHPETNGYCYWQVDTPWLTEGNIKLGTIQLKANDTHAYERVAIDGRLISLTDTGWEKLADWLVEQGVHVEMVVPYRFRLSHKYDYLKLSCHQPAGKTVSKNRFPRC